MTKFLRVLFLFSLIGSIKAYTPLTYYNGYGYNLTTPYGLSLITPEKNKNKFTSAAPSFQITPFVWDSNLFSAGVGIELLYRQNLDFVTPGLYLQASSPFLYFEQAVLIDVIPILSAGKLVAHDFADINVGIGYKIKATEKQKLETYVDVIIPTGSRRNAFNDFEPLVGNGRHFAVGLGYSWQYRLLGSNKHHLLLTNDVAYHYLFAHTEKNLKTGRRSIPEVNVTITPGSTLDAAAGLMYRYKPFFVASGLSVNAHEKTTLKNDPLQLVNLRSNGFILNSYSDLGFVFHNRYLPCFLSIGTIIPLIKNEGRHPYWIGTCKFGFSF